MYRCTQALGQRRYKLYTRMDDVSKMGSHNSNSCLICALATIQILSIHRVRCLPTVISDEGRINTYLGTYQSSEYVFCLFASFTEFWLKTNLKTWTIKCSKDFIIWMFCKQKPNTLIRLVYLARVYTYVYTYIYYSCFMAQKLAHRACSVIILDDHYNMYVHMYTYLPILIGICRKIRLRAWCPDHSTCWRI